MLFLVLKNSLLAVLFYVSYFWNANMLMCNIKQLLSENLPIHQTYPVVHCCNNEVQNAAFSANNM